MRAYIRKCWPDFLLCACMAGVLAVTICSGFNLEGLWAGSTLWAFLCSAVVTAVCFAFAYRRVWQIVGIALGVIVCAAAVLYGRSADVIENEAANSAFIFFMVVFVCTVVVFLLGRTRAGTIVLLVLGTEVIAFAAFLEYQTSPWTIILFPVCALVLLIYRIYLVSAMAARLGNVNLGSYALQAFILTLGAAVIAGGLYFAVVRPIDPPTQKLKLLTVLERMEILQVLGISDLSIITNPDLLTDMDPERTEMSGSEEQEPESSPQEDESLPEDESPGMDEESSEVLPEQPETAGTSEYAAVRYSEPGNYLVLVIIGGCILLIAAAYAVRIAIRYVWHRKVMNLSPSGAAVNYYSYFTKRLGRAGIRRAQHQTLKDFVQMNDVKLRSYDVGGATFAGLTAAYEQIIYCGGGITGEELAGFEAFYASFHRNLRKQVGTVRYYLTAFRY